MAQEITIEQKIEFRPDNWYEILHENMNLDWIKANAKFYILSHRDTSAYALIWKVAGTEDRGWQGVRLKREYHVDKGYYMEYEPAYTDVQWSLSQTDRNDITSDFEKAIELANQH